MRAARKGGPTRGMRSTRFSARRSRRLPRNPLQNPLKLKIPLMPPVVPEGIFVKVSLQVFGAHVVVHAADPALNKTPESLNRLSVNVTRDVDAARVSYGDVRPECGVANPTTSFPDDDRRTSR